MCPSLIEIGSKTAEKNPAQTDKQTDRHYENNGHLAVNQIRTTDAVVGRRVNGCSRRRLLRHVMIDSRRRSGVADDRRGWSVVVRRWRCLVNVDEVRQRLRHAGCTPGRRRIDAFPVGVDHRAPVIARPRTLGPIIKYA